QMHAQPWGRCTNERPFETRQFCNRPLRRVLARPGGNQPVRLALLAKKTENGRERRQPDPPLPQPRGGQPRVVKFKAGGEQSRDAVVKAGDEQAPDAGFNHAQEFLITSDTWSAAIPSVNNAPDQLNA